MNERDRKIVEELRSLSKAFGEGDCHLDEIDKALKLIDRLETNEKQLREKVKELIEAGKPFRVLIANMEPSVPDWRVVRAESLFGGKQVAYLDIGHIRRLVEKLEEIEDE